ncbi:conserved hypothetical protein, partial [Trichinella spiralis]|uniref:hypothetical protein n=1 Tax=Trichinella spiralis TaxID=6334 RepID=UPI0001EFBE19
LEKKQFVKYKTTYLWSKTQWAAVSTSELSFSVSNDISVPPHRYSLFTLSAATSTCHGTEFGFTSHPPTIFEPVGNISNVLGSGPQIFS